MAYLACSANLELLYLKYRVGSGVPLFNPAGRNSYSSLNNRVSYNSSSPSTSGRA